MKNKKFPVSVLFALAAILVLANPQWLPLPEGMITNMKQLLAQAFLSDKNATLRIEHLLVIALMLCIVWIAYRLLNYALAQLAQRSSRSRTVAGLLESFLKYAAAIVAVIWGLSILGVDTGAALASLGIVGLILGFGAQSLIEDVITGIFIIVEGQYAIGDIIVLDDFRGTVRRIGVRTTTIEDAGGNLKIVNNSDIRNMQNRSRNISIATTDVGVSYGTDLRQLLALLSEELPKMYEPNKDVYLAAPTLLGVQSLGDSSVVLRFAVNCNESNIFAAQRRLNLGLKLLFDDRGVEIPFPQVVVHNG